MNNTPSLTERGLLLLMPFQAQIFGYSILLTRRGNSLE